MTVPTTPMMQRYFFNLINDKKIADDRGEMCTFAEAQTTALDVAAELGRNQSRNKIRGLSISVTDASGAELFRTPVRTNL